ncbi:MAG: right-handed parallel beta-helix repeat-containing protein [Anaerolineae bacterium]
MGKYFVPAVGLVVLCSVLALATASGAPDTITVDSTTDVLDALPLCTNVTIGSLPGPDGVTSLREGICAANKNPGPDTIEFDIPTSDPGYQVSGVSGTWTISLTAWLPALSGGGTVISGTTQAVNAGVSNPNGPEIEITGSVSTGNCLGISSADNVIHGLAINRCPGSGVSISFDASTAGNTISGNYIGTDPSGQFDWGNGGTGVYIGSGAHDNVIGGDTPGERNVISGNDNYGVQINHSGTDGNVVSGNYIGTDAAGTQDLGNSWDGIGVFGGAQNNVMGGDTAGQRNLISGNGGHGVRIVGSGTMTNTISGNYIGTDVSGTQDLGNSGHGVGIVSSASRNVVGGGTSGERNIISGNDWYGVQISGSGTMTNTISGNCIGTDVSGTQDLGNSRDGVRIESQARHNTVGPDNVIWANDSSGVRVLGDGTDYNKVTHNSIYNNTELGIALQSLANEEIATPVISTASCTSASGSDAPANGTVELFTGPDDEGKSYLTSVVADGSGNWSASGILAKGFYLTATATDLSGNTSEFSAPASGCERTYVPLAMKRY